MSIFLKKRGGVITFLFATILMALWGLEGCKKNRVEAVTSTATADTNSVTANEPAPVVFVLDSTDFFLGMSWGLQGLPLDSLQMKFTGTISMNHLKGYSQGLERRLELGYDLYRCDDPCSVKTSRPRPTGNGGGGGRNDQRLGTPTSTDTADDLTEKMVTTNLSSSLLILDRREFQSSGQEIFENKQITNTYYYGRQPKDRTPFALGLGAYSTPSLGAYGMMIEVADTSLLCPRFWVGGGIAGNGKDVLGYSFVGGGQYTTQIAQTPLVAGAQINGLGTYTASRDTMTLTQEIEGEKYSQDLRVWTRQFGGNANIQLMAGVRPLENLAVMVSGGLTTTEATEGRGAVAPIGGFHVLGRAGNNVTMRASATLVPNNGLGITGSINFNLNTKTSNR